MAIRPIHTAAEGKRRRAGRGCDAGVLPSPSLLDVEAPGGETRIGLPHDPCMVAACRNEEMDCHDAAALRVTVSSLRTEPVALDTRGNGQIAVALLSPLDVLRAFGCPLRDLASARIPLRDLVSAQAEAELQRALIDAASGGERDAVLGRWLQGRIADRRCLVAPAERVTSVAMSLLDGDGVGIDELARRHATSRRQLERDFHHWLGVTPGVYARLVRFQRAVGAVADGVPLAHVAADHGYADQAHMTRTFREIAGITPREVRARATGTDGLRAALMRQMVMLPGSAASHRLAA